MPKLVLMRHGITQWTEERRFSGWGDSPLSAKGENRARKAGQLLRQEGFAFDICHTSRLARAERTLDVLMEELGGPKIPTNRYWRLNERHYGVLQERSRMAIAKHYGVKATIAWRRSYRARPPALEEDDPRCLEQRQRFPDIVDACIPRSESLEDGVHRVEPYWREDLAPALRAGQRVLLVAHTCSIRGLVRILDGLNDEEAEAFRIPGTVPMIYELGANLKTFKSYRLSSLSNDWLRSLRNRYKPRWLYWR